MSKRDNEARGLAIASCAALLIIAAGVSIAIVENDKIKREIQSQASDVLKTTKKFVRYYKKIAGRIVGEEEIHNETYDTNWKDALDAIENH